MPEPRIAEAVARVTRRLRVEAVLNAASAGAVLAALGLVAQRASAAASPVPVAVGVAGGIGLAIWLAWRGGHRATPRASAEAIERVYPSLDNLVVTVRRVDGSARGPCGT